jgi:Tol biopolymer transport system component
VSVRKRAAFTSLLWLILAALCMGAVSVASAAHLPVLMFRAYRNDDDGYGDFYLYDLHHQFTIRLTSPDVPNVERFAVMSPDRLQIALTSASGDFGALGLMQFEEYWQLGSSFVTLVWDNQEINWGNAAWSPHIGRDVMYLAFTTNIDPTLESDAALDFDIWVFSVPMRQWQPSDLLLTGEGDLVPPVGDEILQTGRRLTDDDYYDYDIAWSPDGSQMAFVSNRDLNFEIYLLDTTGVNQNIRRITNHLSPDRHPTWSRDGQWLAFASERDGNSEIYVVSVNGGEPRRVTDNESRNLEPAWSPDGTHIAYLADGVITLVRPDGSGIQPFFHGSDVTWMP